MAWRREHASLSIPPGPVCDECVTLTWRSSLRSDATAGCRRRAYSVRMQLIYRPKILTELLIHLRNTVVGAPPRAAMRAGEDGDLRRVQLKLLDGESVAFRLGMKRFQRRIPPITVRIDGGIT